MTATLAVAAVLVAVVVTIARRCPMPVPTIGVFDRSDIVLLSVAVVCVPFALLAVPPWMATVLFAILMATSLADLLRAFGVSSPVRSPVALALPIVAWVADACDMPGAWLAVDVLLVVVLAVGVGMWLQAGLRIDHVVLISVVLTAYDVVATHLTGFMERLLEHLGDTSLGLVFEMQLADRSVFLGLGDVLFMALAVGAAFSSYRAPEAWFVTGWIALGFAVAAAMVFHGDGAVVPVMVTLGPATWMAVAMVAPHRRVAQPSDRALGARVPPLPLVMATHPDRPTRDGTFGP